MIFYVYFEPEIIGVARQNGTYALQALIAILRGFLQNCFILEFEDLRNDAAIKEELANLPDDFDRAALKKIVGVMKKRHLFISCLEPDYTGEKSDLTCIIEQRTDALLDLLLLTERGDVPMSDGVEVATLADYQNTDFEAERSRLASEGRTFHDGQLRGGDFLESTFKKAFRFAARLEICDRLFGREYGPNFEYSTREFLGWLETIIYEPVALERVIFHCGVPADAYGLDESDIVRDLSATKRGRLANISIEVRFYAQNSSLPHERFILTDQVAFEIGRGMDFLNRATGMNRDVMVNYKSFKELTALLAISDNTVSDSRLV
jgi:hypothetical protein